MEKLARKLANNIAKSLGYDSEKEAVMAYGLIAIIQIIITVLLVLILGIIIGAPVEALIVCFSVSIFRKYSGGAHAGSAELCTAFSLIYCIAAAMLSKYVLFQIYNIGFMITAIIIIYALSFLAVYKLAPVDSPNKPIGAKKKKKMKKGSFIVLSVYFAISIIFAVLGLKYSYLNSYGISLLFGIAWQVFTLTNIGSQFLNHLNRLFLKGGAIRQ